MTRVADKKTMRIAGPVSLAVATVLGLVIALIGEGGIWWIGSWTALSLPAIASIYFGFRGLGQ